MKKTASRLSALDGLRGLAILLVFFNHITSKQVSLLLPTFLRPVWGTLTSSGHLGVTFLFLLSGFLMSYLYPQVKDNTAFWQKRYTRIFPLFVSLVFSRAIMRNFSDLSLPYYLAAIFLPAVAVHLLWSELIQRLNNQKLNRALFWFFLILQVLAALVYGFYFMRRPALYFNQLLPVGVRESFITLANLTLVLPMGNYIPMLDGVYWTLMAEVTFYLLYPLVFAPVASLVAKEKTSFKVFFLLALMPFFLAWHYLSKHLFGLFIYNFSFFYYFVIGITIAYFYRSSPKWFKVPGLLALILVLVFWGVYNQALINYPAIVPEIRLLGAWGWGLLFLAVLAEKSLFERFFAQKWLVWIGQISYSLYLVHTSVVDYAKKLYQPVSPIDNLLFVLGSLIAAILAAAVLHWLLEKPYFAKKQAVQKLPAPRSLVKLSPRFIPLILASFSIIAIFLGYQSNFNFFSKQYTYSSETINSPKIREQSLSLKQNKVKLEFQAKENNLGVLTFNFSYLGGKQANTLVIRLKEKGAKSWLSESTYRVEEVGNSAEHPFGFPLIVDSQGKNYEVEMFLTNKSKVASGLVLNLNQGAFQSVHQLNKSALIKQPVSVLSLLVNKLTNMAANREAQFVFVYLLPVLGLSFWFLKRPYSQSV